jgi:oligopeptide transport system substrate-binding protein
MKRISLFFFAWLCFLSACDGDSQNRLKAPLRYGTADLPHVINPQRADSSSDQMLAGQLFLGLVTVNASGHIIPGLAKSWVVSPDGLNYIFRLRTSEWSDGVPVTAETFVRSFQLLFHPATAAPRVNDYRAILNADSVLLRRKAVTSLGVRALAPDVLEIKLAQPQPSFLDLLASPAAAPLPLHVLTGASPGLWPGPAKLVVNGPYRIESLGSVEVRLTPNKKYVLGHAADRLAINYELAADPARALSQFLGGDFDVLDAQSLPPDVLQSESRLRQQTRHEPQWAITQLLVQKSDPKLKDWRMRRVLALLVDRQKLVESVFSQQEFQPAFSLAPSLLTSYPLPGQPDWSGWTQTQRTDEAQRLMTELDISVEKPVGLTVLAVNTTQNEKILDFLARELKPHGIDLRVELLAPKNLFRKISNRDYQLALGSWSTMIDQPDGFFRPFFCNKPAGNSLNYCNVEVDELLVSALQKTDPVVRATEFQRAERLILQDLPVVPLFVPVRQTLVAKNITGWQDNPTGRHPLERLARARRGL